MKQKQYAPMSIADMALSLYAAERGFLTDVEVSKVGSFEQALIAYFNRDHAELMAKINVKGDFNDESTLASSRYREVQGHPDLVSRSGGSGPRLLT